jgi:hypothetical protein
LHASTPHRCSGVRRCPPCGPRLGVLSSMGWKCRRGLDCNNTYSYTQLSAGVFRDCLPSCFIYFTGLFSIVGVHLNTRNRLDLPISSGCETSQFQSAPVHSPPTRCISMYPQILNFAGVAQLCTSVHCGQLLGIHLTVFRHPNLRRNLVTRIKQTLV